MFRRVLMLVLPLCALASGPNAVIAQERAPITSQVQPPLDVAAPPAANRGIDPALQKKVELRRRIGQLMFVTADGALAPSSAEQRFLAEYTPGGAVVPSALRPQTIADYVVALRSLPLEANGGVPMLIGTDMNSLPKMLPDKRSFFVQIPSLLSIAAGNGAGAMRTFGGILGEHLSAMGVNAHLGPSLELAPTLPGAKGSVDLLGSDPKMVAEAGVAIMRACEEHGVIAIPMGFPGGGANRLREESPVLLTPADYLLERDLYPYQQVIQAGASIIHVGNTLVPTVDETGGAASVSPVVMQGLLRGALKFDGVILAGPMDAPELARNHDPAEASVLALKAGADMLLWRQSGTRLVRAMERVARALETGEWAQEEFDAAVSRIMKLKQEKDLLGKPMPTAAQAAKLTKSSAYPKDVRQIERQSITLIVNRNNALPLTMAGSMPAGCTGTVGVVELGELLDKHLKAVPAQLIRSAKHDGRIHDFEIERIMKRFGPARTVIAVLSSQEETRDQVNLLRSLKNSGKRVVLVYLGYPHNVTELQMADAILLAFTEGERIQQTLEAVAGALVGRCAPGFVELPGDLKTVAGQVESFQATDLIRAPAGRLPVTIGGPFVAGLGVSYDPTLSIKKAEWDFGDGKKAKGLVVQHAYAEPGRYPLTLTVTDQEGAVISQTFYTTVGAPS